MAERERDELDRAVRRLEAERVATPARRLARRPLRASVEQLREFDREWLAAEVRGRRGRRNR